MFKTSIYHLCLSIFPWENEYETVKYFLKLSAKKLDKYKFSRPSDSLIK